MMKPVEIKNIDANGRLPGKLRACVYVVDRQECLIEAYIHGQRMP